MQDLELTRREITGRHGKGGKDRLTVLPSKLIEPLQIHLERVNAIHDKDLEESFGAVYLPFALERKYPNANRE